MGRLGSIAIHKTVPEEVPLIVVDDEDLPILILESSPEPEPLPTPAQGLFLPRNAPRRAGTFGSRAM